MRATPKSLKNCVIVFLYVSGMTMGDVVIEMGFTISFGIIRLHSNRGQVAVLNQQAVGVHLP